MTLRAGDVELDNAGFCLVIDGSSVDLTRKEFLIVHVLMTKKNQVLAPSDIVDYAFMGKMEHGALKTHIYRINKKAGRKLIESRHGFGYIIRGEDTADKHGGSVEPYY